MFIKKGNAKSKIIQILKLTRYDKQVSEEDIADGILKIGGIMKTFEDAVDEVLLELRGVLIAKQHDYGHANIMEFGLEGVLVRANDKMARLKNLRGKDAKNESVRDSWIDEAGYSIIAIMLMNGTFDSPLRDNE